MADKVLAIVRETMLHHNELESFSFQPTTGVVVLSLLQPDDRFQYPEHELQLTFAGLRTLQMDGVEGSGGALAKISFSSEVRKAFCCLRCSGTLRTLWRM